MRIVATSDCHGKLAEATLPPGDVLVLAGDILADAPDDAADPLGWQVERLRELDAFLRELPYRAVVLVAGNHDGVLQERPELLRTMWSMHLHGRYLEDAGCEIDGVRFYGSPWQPGLWHHPFFKSDGGESYRTYQRIPTDTQVLVTHSPPWGILDEWDAGVGLGSRMLRARVATLRPPVHIFGHVHPSYGMRELCGTRFYNAALCNGDGEPVNAPHVIDL